ncbi:MAG: hypothetical protein K2J97_01900 [Muribaculaceae bacterium]|nr:hypothetical protein [Muribaculaceae bacterium]
MKKIAISFILAVVALTAVTSCSKEEAVPVNYGEVLSGNWKTTVQSDDYVSETTISLRSTYTYSFSQSITVDDIKIVNMLSGAWEYSEADNTITFTLTDKDDNTQHMETGMVDLQNKTLTITNRIFTRPSLPATP